MRCVLDDLQDARIPVTLLGAGGVVVLKHAVELAHALIRIARRLYAEQSIGVDFTETVYALDSTTIDLCLTQRPWARFPRSTAAIKLHTLLALRGAIPTFIHISDGKLHDVNVLDLLIPEPAPF